MAKPKRCCWMDAVVVGSCIVFLSQLILDIQMELGL